MTTPMARSPRPPTDEDRKTEIYDPARARTLKPTQRGIAPHAEDVARGKARYQIEQATPTEISPPSDLPFPQEIAPREASEPIRVISMKHAAVQDTGKHQVRQHQVQLRPLAEVKRPDRHDTPAHGLGYLAPPRDPRGVRTRRLRDLVIWGCVVVMLASVVMIGIWLLARH